MTMSVDEEFSGEIPSSPEQLTWPDRLIEARQAAHLTAQATEDPGHSASSSANSTTTTTATVAPGTSALSDGGLSLVTTASQPGKISLFRFFFFFVRVGSGLGGGGKPGAIGDKG